MKKAVFILAALWFTTAWAGAAQAQKPLRVVATLSTFADLAKQIGGDRVEVSFVASPRFNPHFIEPKPSDVLRVKRADLFVHAGLDLELWRWPLVDAAGNPDVRPGGSRELDLSKGIRLLEVPDRPLSRAEGDIHLYGNPHYWLNPENLWRMAETLAEKLAELDPAHADGYRDRLEDFHVRLQEKLPEWKRIASGVRGKEAVAYHNAWPYLADFTGIRIEQFLEPKPGVPPTPRQVAFLGGYIQREAVAAIFQASFFPETASRRLAEKTGARLVFLCQNVGERPEVPDVIRLIDYNVRQVADALK